MRQRRVNAPDSAQKLGIPRITQESSGNRGECVIFFLTSTKTEPLMTLKTALIALALAVTPGLAFAYCSGATHQTTASACAEGLVLDTATGICMPPATS